MTQREQGFRSRHRTGQHRAPHFDRYRLARLQHCLPYEWLGRPSVRWALESMSVAPSIATHTDSTDLGNIVFNCKRHVCVGKRPG
jgi:hypothetical protein